MKADPFGRATATIERGRVDSDVRERRTPRDLTAAEVRRVIAALDDLSPEERAELAGRGPTEAG